ncbi:hypothetical protein CC86DRAFT_399450 [Ophiobolus disseminans]|uniref:Uncharacterized protein n=1 Tax=Ophiobolus disseminans TaxID=1469910 RepID=A0A6A7AJL6_9PLEO|nr:hypothetical protein CC86DRAFT_399450 [Ophiobolus disseminans]
MQFTQNLLFFGLVALGLRETLHDVTFSDFAGLSNFKTSDLLSDSNGDSTSHERRWAPGPIPNPAANDVWEAAKCKEKKFMAQMSYSDYDVGQILPTPVNTAVSPWELNDLKPSGYIMPGVDQAYRDFSTGGFWGVADFFRHIGISDRCREEGGKWFAAVITHYRLGMPGTVPAKHEQTYPGPDGHIRRVSGAYFYMAVNPERGIHYELPNMRALSDMMWAMWEYHTPDNARANMNFFMSLGINNPPTLTIIRRAMDSAGQQLSTTPYRFNIDSDGALALLGSPNGARFAHFLIQRKNQIGMKTVTGVHAFECVSRSHDPRFMFTVGPIQAVPWPQQQVARADEERAPTKKKFI